MLLIEKTLHRPFVSRQWQSVRFYDWGSFQDDMIKEDHMIREDHVVRGHLAGSQVVLTTQEHAAAPGWYVDICVLQTKREEEFTAERDQGREEGGVRGGEV